MLLHILHLTPRRKVALLRLNLARGFLIFVCLFCLLLISASPIRTDAPIAGISIREESNTFVRIWSHAFSCTRGDRQASCEVTLQKRPLQMTLVYSDNSKARDSIRCQAVYAQKAVQCSTYFDYATGDLPYVVFNSSLGLTKQELQELQKENFIAQISDNEWTKLAEWIAIAAAIAAALYIWLSPNYSNPVKVLVCLFSSGITYYLTSYCLLLSLLFLGFVD